MDVIKNMPKNNQTLNHDRDVNQVTDYNKNKFVTLESNEFINPQAQSSTLPQVQASQVQVPQVQVSQVQVPQVQVPQDSAWTKASSKTSKYTMTTESLKANTTPARFSALTTYSSCTDSDTASVSADSVGSRQSESMHHSSVCIK